MDIEQMKAAVRPPTQKEIESYDPGVTTLGLLKAHARLKSKYGLRADKQLSELLNSR